MAAAVVAVVAVALAGCGGAARSIVLPAGSQVLARGSLAYAVAFAADGRVVSVELEERFALVVRSPDGRRLGAYDLGPAERDLVALAVAGDVAWVGGDDQRLRALALADGATVATWPVGADVTALAAVGELVAIGDGGGAVCVRRRADGALLQCVQLARGPVDALVVAGDVLLVVAGAERHGLRVPSLAVVPPPADPRPARPGSRELRVGGARLRFGGPVRAIAVDGAGRVAIAAWIARLDDPSVVLLPPRAR